MVRKELVSLAKELGMTGYSKMKNDQVAENINAILDNIFQLADVEEVGYKNLELQEKYNAYMELQQNLKEKQEEEKTPSKEENKKEEETPDDDAEFQEKCKMYLNDPMAGCISFGKFEPSCDACKELKQVGKRTIGDCPSERRTTCIRATKINQQQKILKVKTKKKKKNPANVNFINHRIGCQVAIIDEMLLSGMTKDEGTDAIYDGTVTGAARIKDERYKKLFARVGNQIRHLKVDHGVTIREEKVPNRGTVYFIDREDAEAHKSHLEKKK